jgi:hypothetical protein
VRAVALNETAPHHGTGYGGLAGIHDPLGLAGFGPRWGEFVMKL